MDSFTLRPTQGKKIVQVNVNFVETDDVKQTVVTKIVPSNAPSIQIAPEDIKIGQWTHTNPTISKDFVIKYIVKYINEQILPAFGKFVVDWVKQVTFNFVDNTSSPLVTTGNAGSLDVTIQIGSQAKIERMVDYYSSETVKSMLKWMQVESQAFNTMVNNNFFANRWISVIVDGVTYHGLLISNTGIVLGAS